jgi:thiamine-phosphate pyrophosphorylase
LLFFTDPWRTPHPAAAAARLPKGAAVVFRHFGQARALRQAPALRALARRRGLRFLVGADVKLAGQLRADGVHLPERLAYRAGAIRRAQPGWLVTAAAHSARAVIAARRAGAMAVVISPVFPSRSPSAGRPLGVLRFAALSRLAPAYALGGVDARTAARLAATRAIGIAGIEGLTA